MDRIIRFVRLRHTNIPNPCPSCEKELETAHPEIAAWFRNFVKPRHPDAHVSDAWRDKAEQNQFYAEGRSKAPWPKSKHNTTLDGKPCSLALDLFELANNGMGCWRWSYFKKIADESKAEGWPVDWAGWWRTFAEGPHFELTNQTVHVSKVDAKLKPRSDTDGPPPRTDSAG